MIIWGGSEIYESLNSGAKYNPAIDSWSATSITVNTPSARVAHAAVWTGSEMILWGGYPSSPPGDTATGGRYNPATDTWTPTSMLNAPEARENPTAVWTGREMIMWGGLGCQFGNCRLNTGSRYNPSTDSWAPTSMINVPAARGYHSALWTGREMLIWGGAACQYTNSGCVLNTGARYNPQTDTWTTTGVPSNPNTIPGRFDHTAVWTGSQMLIWGGLDLAFNSTSTGGRYNTSTNGWDPINLADAPSPRFRHTGVWTGHEMIIWGGAYPSSGRRYNPETDNWVPTTTTNAPVARDLHTAVWTGTAMIIWGGEDYNGNPLDSGGIYYAEPSTPLVLRAVSRKAHGNAGTFDLDLPLSGTPGIECRSGGVTSDYTLLVTFLANVSVNGNPQAAVTSGIGTIGSGGVRNGGMVTTSGNVLTIPLTNVANAQTINVTLNNVNGSTNLTIPMSLLIGDVDGDGFVNSGDALQTRNRSGQATDTTNFRSDVNADGFVNSGDTVIVRARSGAFLP